MYLLRNAFVIVVFLSVSVQGQPAQTSPAMNLPQVPDSVLKTGSEFLSETKSLDFKARQEAAVKWILAGHIPSFLRELTPVKFQNAKGETALIWVTRDYLSIGSEEDFIRIPLSFPSAQTIASSVNMYLPTTVMVDSIYAQSSKNLTPIPMKPGEQMRSNDYYQRHNEMIEDQLKGEERDQLISGHKKDLVITNRLNEQKGRVAIYGWHYALRDPIQPLSLVHSEGYEDYSHGLRLIFPVAEVQGKAVELKNLINKGEWNEYFTKEGNIEIDRLSQGK